MKCIFIELFYIFKIFPVEDANLQRQSQTFVIRKGPLPSGTSESTAPHYQAHTLCICPAGLFFYGLESQDRGQDFSVHTATCPQERHPLHWLPF